MVDRQVSASIDNIQRDSNPAVVVQTLEFLSFQLWARSKIFLNTFLKLDGLRSVIDLLKPSHRAKEPERILIKMHHSVHGPTVLYEVYDAVIVGCAAEVLSKILSMQPSLMDSLVVEQPWIVDTLTRLLVNGNDMEVYGAMSAMEVLMSSRVVRSSLDESSLLRNICNILKRTNSLKHEGNTLLSHIRWKFAMWRVCFDVVTLLLLPNDIDLHVDDQQGSQVPLRQDFRSFDVDGQLVVQLMGVFEFAYSQIPKSNSEKGTVFSGVGIFKGSAMSLNDIGGILRSAAFLLQRVGYHSPEAKSYMMRRYGIVRTIKELGAFVNDVEAAVLIQLLMFMGVGAPTSQIKPCQVMAVLESQDSKAVLRALRMLTDEQIYMVGNEAWTELMSNTKFVATIVQLALGQHKDNSSSVVKLQKSVSRGMTTLPSQCSFNNVIQSYALVLIGLMYKHFIKQATINVQQHLPDIIQQLNGIMKSGFDIQKWACSQFLANLQVSGQKVDQSLVVLVLDSLAQKSKSDIFSNKHDKQWLFEFQTGALKMMLVRYETGLLAQESEMQLFMTSFQVLHSIAQLHGQVDVKQIQPDLKRSLFAKPNQHQMQNRNEAPYQKDDTLPNLVLIAVQVIQQLCNTICSTQSMLTNEYLNILKIFGRFCCQNVQKVVTSIFQQQIELVQAPDNQSWRVKELRQMIRVIGFCDGVWPLELVRDPVYESAVAARNGAPQSVRPYLIDFAAVKICKKCGVKEHKHKQFLVVKDVCYCSRQCLPSSYRTSHQSQLLRYSAQ